MIAATIEISIVLLLQPFHPDMPNHSQVRLELLVCEPVKLEQLVLLLDLK